MQQSGGQARQGTLSFSSFSSIVIHAGKKLINKYKKVVFFFIYQLPIKGMRLKKSAAVVFGAPAEVSACSLCVGVSAPQVDTGRGPAAAIQAERPLAVADELSI